MKKHLINSSLLLLCSLMFTFSANANARTYKAIAFPAPGAMESPTKGALIELALHAFERMEGDTLEIEMLPARRANREFKNGNADLFIAGDATIDSPSPDEQSQTIKVHTGFTTGQMVLTRAGSPLLKTVSDLKGKIVGILAGWEYPETFVNDESIIKEPTASLEQNIKKLLKGRVDALLDDTSLLMMEIDKLSVEDKVQYDINSDPILPYLVTYDFQNTPAGETLSNNFIAAMKELVAEGLPRKIFEKNKMPKIIWSQEFRLDKKFSGPFNGE